MGYGKHEFKYASPFAEALVNDLAFRSWVLKKTCFIDFADEAWLLNREVFKKRSPRTQTWWRSHYQELCRCPGCSGQETDLLAIFETKTGVRFALHVEVKHPQDSFKDDLQAPAYPLRAGCWIAKTPKYILPHSAATTLLLFPAMKKHEYKPHLKHFASALTFESIRTVFPRATADNEAAASLDYT